MGRIVRIAAAASAGGLVGGAPAVGVTRDVGVEVLFMRHYVELLRLAFCLLGDRGRAEDAVQEAFISVYRHWDGLRDQASALPYLRSAVINRCRTGLRQRLRELGPGEFEVEGPAPDRPEEQAIVSEDHDRLARAVRGLPRRQREVVVCRYYLELSIPETATLLGITAGSVKRHAHRGLKALGISVGGER